MRGRKPTPTVTRLLRGNPGRRPVNDREPDLPAFGSDPRWASPTELEDNPRALLEWSRLAPMLQRCRQITEADRAALLALCLEWARYLDASSKVRTLGLVVKTPSGYPIPNPYLPIATRALAACNKLWPELGLTPSSRSRVTVAGPGPDTDPFAEFDEAPRLRTQ